MRNLIRFLLAAALLAATPAGATDFKTWVPGLATKTTAPGATDYYAIVPNGGATEKVPGTSLLWSANNLSDLASAATARTNLGLGALATESGVTAAQMLALPSADLYVGNGSNLPAAVALSGDCTLANTGAITCTKTGGVAFGPLATESAITSGQLPGLASGSLWIGNGSNAATQQALPASGDIVVSGGNAAPTGLAPSTNGDCAVVASGAWALGSCGGGGFSSAVNRITTGTSNTLASITAPVTTELWVSATAGAKTDTVPGCTSGLNGDTLIEADGEGNAAANPITITASSGTIGQAGTPAPGTSFAISTNGGAAAFECDGTGTRWVLKGSAGAGTGVNYQTGTSYTVAATDNNGVIDQSNASAIADTLPQAGTTGFPEAGFSVLIRNKGVGTVTVTPTTSTINGASSATITSSNALWIFADNAGNYEGVPIAGPLGNSGVTAGSYTNANITVNAQGIVTAASNGTGGSGGLSITPIAGAWYFPYLNAGMTTGSAAPSGNIYCTPGVLLGPVHLESLGAYITTAGSGNVQLAIYNVGSWGYPSTLVASTASLADNGTAPDVVSGAITTGALAAGEYFFCRQNSDSTVVMDTLTGVSGAPSALYGQPYNNSMFNAPQLGYYTTEATYGTWPTFTNATSWTINNQGPAIEVQVSSSP